VLLAHRHPFDLLQYDIAQLHVINKGH